MSLCCPKHVVAVYGSAMSSLLLQGAKFFWRSQENIDVAFHFNKDEEVITISTHSHERGYNYPAIFVDVSKIPVSKADAVRPISRVQQSEADVPRHHSVDDNA